MPQPSSCLSPSLSEKQIRRGSTPIEEKLKRDLLGVRGVTTKAPLAYLVRDDLKSKAQGDDPWSSFTDYDSQLVMRTSILTDTAARGASTVDELEEQGPSAKRPEVNVDNAQLYDIIDTVANGVSTLIHPHQVSTADEGWPHGIPSLEGQPEQL